MTHGKNMQATVNIQVDLNFTLDQIKLHKTTLKDWKLDWL